MVVCNQSTNYVSKFTTRPIILRIQSQKKLREMKLRKLSTETEKQTISVLIEAWKKKTKVIFGEKRQRHLNASSRTQKSP